MRTELKPFFTIFGTSMRALNAAIVLGFSVLPNLSKPFCVSQSILIRLIPFFLSVSLKLEK